MKRFFSLIIVSKLAPNSKQLPIQREPEALSPGIKRREREADHSPPYRAKFKNAWIYTSALTYIFMA
jgi:hypothetical protein